MFLTDYWYVVAWSDDLSSDVPLARTILGVPIVLFRQIDGTPVALQDRCAHRGVPLSLGRVAGNCIQCGYHGLEYNAAGACVKVPGQSRIPQGMTVKSYPVIERWRWIWVWMGDQERAKPDLIPDFHWLDDPEWTAPTGQFLLKTNHELLIENLHNHIHLQFVHQSTIGSSALADIDAKVERIGDEIHITRWVLDKPAPPLYAKLGGFTGNVDRWSNSVFLAPSNVILDNGCAPVGSGAPAGDRSKGIEFRSMHAVTPETKNTTHYFWGYARNFKLDDPAVTELLGDGARLTFAEDAAILEAQQRNLEMFPDEPMKGTGMDAGGILVQRLRAELATRIGTRD